MAGRAGSMRFILPVAIAGFAAGWAGVACNQRPSSNDEGTCDPLAADCNEGLVCDPVLDGDPRCAEPVAIVGIVLHLADNSPIAGALVQAVDVNGAAVGTSAVTDANGSYTLTVPALRDQDGAPVEGIYTLRAQAEGFQEFPTAIRPALPLDATSAVRNETGDSGWVIENALTTIGLLALPGDLTQLGSISGAVEGDRNAGILVVAEGAAGAFIGYSDSEGLYTIFNVPAGNYTVRGYAAGVQFESQNVSVAPGEDLGDADLAAADRPLSTVSGNVQIVNAPGGSMTSVVLAMESTFIETVARGSVPPGLRVGNISGAFVIEDVPDGRYVVLAAFENDNLVRDPDENISGTQIIHIQVPDPASGNSLVISEGFKITEALGVLSPGSNGPEAITTPTPTFTWADDSSEDGFLLLVFDAFGNVIWNDELPSVSGSASVSHVYAGPALQVGMFYQFRATSFRERSGSRSAISTTEDLKGVFFLPAP